RAADPLELAWSLTVGGRPAAEGKSKQILKVPPGTAEPTQIRFQVPQVKERATGELTLVLRRNGQEVFRDVKPVHVLAADGHARPALAPTELAVLDPKGIVTNRLKQRGVGFRAVTSFEALPAGVKVLVVGPDALTPRQATDPRWVGLAASGLRVLVL